MADGLNPDPEDIRKLICEQVVKRELIEGDEAAAAAKAVKKALKKSLREKVGASAALSAAAPSADVKEAAPD